MDYANVLDANTKAALEKRIIDFRNTSNPRVELAVAIVKTTGERPIFDYSLAVARGWGIGSKESDNPGALLLIAIDDRKYVTQVSKDLEDELPDGLVGQLQRENLVPAFRQQDYGKGITDTINAYIRQIQAKQTGAPAPPVQPQEQSGRQNKESLSGGFCCIIIVIIFLIIIFSRGGRGGSGGGGGSFWLPVILGSVLNDAGRSSSSGSGWGGGSSGGGGDSWGGFGGGGDFGGGGAGGGW